MSRKKILVKALVVLAGLFLLSASTVYSELCNGDFDCDGDVDGRDVGWFKTDAGREDCPECPPCENCQAYINNNIDNICEGYPCVPPAPVPKTGSTIDDTTGEDGDLQKGVAWPNPRFTDNGDETVTDNLTGLMWTKDANLPSGTKTWTEALDYVDGMNAGAGTYGYTDWRLPNRFELESLLHLEVCNPAMPNTAGTGKWTEDDPFTNVHSYYYWSSTTYADDTFYAWSVGMYHGGVSFNVKSYSSYVWPVRGGY